MFHWCITYNLSLQRVMEEYKDKETGLTLIAKINTDRVSLRIPSEKDGWELFALKSLKVMISIFKKVAMCFYSCRKKLWMTISLKEKFHALLLL